jgi:peptide/nickel transport system permease protein
MSSAGQKAATIRSQYCEFWRRFRRNRAGVLGLLVVGLLAVLALFAPWAAPYDSTAVIAKPLVAPGRSNLLGTDNLGRDVLSGVLFGARVSLVVGVLAATTSTTIGLLVGALSGYHRGIVDAVLMRVTELFQVVPRFFLALLIIAMAGPGVGKVIFAIAILSWPSIARVVRAEFLSLREREFVEAARALGAPNRTIIVKHIVPNVLPPTIAVGSLEVAQAILLDAGLSFLGLGDPNLISWGTMLNVAQPFLRTAWWMAVFPGAAIFFAVLGTNFLGDGLNDAMNPRLKTG